MSNNPAGQDEVGGDPLLDVPEAAARARVLPSSWRAGVSRGYFPPPDDPDSSSPRQRRRPRWRLSTVDQAMGARPGQGRRSDLVDAGKKRNQRMAAVLAEPDHAPTAAVQVWLRTNHRSLLTVADVLVDHREELLETAGEDPQIREEIAAAIDQAGEAMNGRPSRLLAAAVAYAYFLIQHGDENQIPDGVREVTRLHARLHSEFSAIRGQGTAS